MLLPYIPLLLGPVVLVLLIKRGCLSPMAMAEGPSRRIGLMPADLLVALGLMIVGPALVMPFAPDAGTGADPEGAAQAVDALTFSYRMLMAQATGQLPPVLYLLWRSSFTQDGPKKIGLVPTRYARDLRYGLLGLLAAIPLVFMTIQATVLIGQLFGQEAPTLAHETLKVLVDTDSVPAIVLMVVSAVIMAPFLEEGIFRGLIQSVMAETLGEDRRWPILIVASFVFAMMHTDLSTWANWQALPGLFVLALVMGWLYERTGSLWPSVIVHVGFNTLNIVMALLLSRAAET